MTPPRCAALVPAAGLGLRLGGSAPKALRLLAGEPLVCHAVRALRASAVELVVVAAPEAELAAIRRLLDPRVQVVTGGATRRDSVAAALAVLPDEVEWVLVHDAARPLVPPALVDAVLAALRAGAPAVVPGLVPVDTIKTVDSAGQVTATPARDSLRAVQTPQGFRRELLDAAHAQQGSPVTDDASLVELLGVPVQVIPGDRLAAKVTTAEDLAALEALLRPSVRP